MKALKRAHIMILATVFTLLVGGTLAFANGFIGGGNDAHGAVVTNSQHGNEGSKTGSENSSQQENQQQQGNTEPTQGTEPTATATPSNWAGKITSVDCTKGTITITLDSNGQSATATLTGGTEYNVGSCANLKSGAHVTIEVQSGNAVHVVQDDSGSTGGTGGGDGSGGGSGSGGGDSTPTPGGSK